MTAQARAFAAGPFKGTRSQSDARRARGDPRREPVSPAALARVLARASVTTRVRGKQGRSGCGDMHCNCDVDDEGYEIKRTMPMMTKQVFINATLRDMKHDEWKILGGELALCVCQ